MRITPLATYVGSQCIIHIRFSHTSEWAFMQHFDQRPHWGSTDPYLIVSLQGRLLCHLWFRWWDVLFVKGMHFSSKNARLLNFLVVSRQLHQNNRCLLCWNLTYQIFSLALITVWWLSIKSYNTLLIFD